MGVGNRKIMDPVSPSSCCPQAAAHLCGICCQLRPQAAAPWCSPWGDSRSYLFICSPPATTAKSCILQLGPMLPRWDGAQLPSSGASLSGSCQRR